MGKGAFILAVGEAGNERQEPLSREPVAQLNARPLVPGSRRGKPGRPRKGDAGIFSRNNNGHILGTLGKVTSEPRTGSQANDRAAVSITNEIVVRSVRRRFSQSLFKACTQGLPCLIRRIKDAGINQEINSRPWVEPNHRQTTQWCRLDHLPIGPEPGFRDSAQAGIRRLHPPERNLLEQLDNGVE